MIVWMVDLFPWSYLYRGTYVGTNGWAGIKVYILWRLSEIPRCSRKVYPHWHSDFIIHSIFSLNSTDVYDLSSSLPQHIFSRFCFLTCDFNLHSLFIVTFILSSFFGHALLNHDLLGIKKMVDVANT